MQGLPEFCSKFLECPHSSISGMLVWTPPLLSPHGKWKVGQILAFGIWVGLETNRCIRQGYRLVPYSVAVFKSVRHMVVCLECGRTVTFNIDAACPGGWFRNVMDAIRNAARPPELITIITVGDCLTHSSLAQRSHFTPHYIQRIRKELNRKVRNELNRKWETSSPEVRNELNRNREISSTGSEKRVVYCADCTLHSQRQELGFETRKLDWLILVDFVGD